MSGINFSKTRPTLEAQSVVYPIAQLYYGTATSLTDLNTRFPNAANNGFATLPSSEAVFRNGSWQEVASGGGAPSKFKGRYVNIGQITAAYPNPDDGDYGYNTAGTLRFYALNGTWQSEVLSFTPPAAAAQYADSQELFTAQGNQLNGNTYEVVDASDDPNVVARGGSSTAFYKYLGVSTQSYSDYELLPATSESGGSSSNEYIGTDIPLSNPSVTYCNMSNASSASSYTLNSIVLGGKARLLINTATIPDIVGAVRIKGDDFQANTDIYLEVENNGVRTEYWVKQISESPAQDLIGLPFGSTIVTTPDATNTFIGDPCILEATSGRVFMSHSYFGASGSNDKESYIYYNDDINSDNWTLIKTFTNFLWGTLFEYNSELFFLGVNDYPLNGVIRISKSTDNGITWSNPITLINIPSGYGGWGNAPINPIFKDGYLVKAFEIRDTTIDRHKFNNACMVFADLTDLMNPSNWSYSNIVPFNDAAMEAAGIYNTNTPNETHGFLEGNIVEKANGDLIDLLRLEQAPNSNNAVYLDVIWDAVTPPNSTLSTTFNFIDMYGGNVKFQVLYDTVSAKHWTITNYNRFKAESDNRIEAYLLSSDDDCETWKSHGKVLGFEATIDWENEIEQLGVQYSHFIIKGSDLYVADRTANEFSNNYHDANLLTLTKIEDFRNIPEVVFEDGSMILDENSNRIEDVNGISVIEDQSSKINSPYMLVSDNAEKPIWSNGIDFNGAQQLRVAHNRHLNIDNGFTVFFVVENLQTISGARLLSKSNGEGGASGDVGVKDYFLAPNTGLGIQNTRGVYNDLTVGDNYIFASSYDNVNEAIYNYLNGANRGTPTSVTDGTFNTDRVELGTSYTVGNFGELIIGNRGVLSNLYMDGLVKAIHIYPEYMTPTEVIAKMTSLNSTYSIY